MHHRHYYHIVWTTHDRAPSIDRATARFLVRYLPAVADRLGAQVLESGLVSTHVHLLVRVPPTTKLPVLLQGMKGGSAAAANREIRSSATGKLRWAHGYSASSVSEATLDRIRRYVRRQSEHHPHDAIPGWPEEPARG
jgi:putative transposase